MKEIFPRALEIAEKAHAGQKRHNGEDYIEHPKRVAAQFKDDFRKTIAAYHDVVEDHPQYKQVLKKEFPKKIYDAVMLLTRKKNENYFNFIMRIRDSQNIDAITVKVADLIDNKKDHDEGSKKDKYRFALYILSNAL